MSLDDFDLYDDLDVGEARTRDPKIDEAKAYLVESIFGVFPRETFYERQVQVMAENEFYHWITSKALHELALEGAIQTEKVALGEKTFIRFYFSNQNRYWKRQAAKIRRLVLRFSTPEFGHALGHHAETMFDAAFAFFRFLPTAKKVTSHHDVRWALSGHNLDRVYSRDGIDYGCEIKNKLDYIEPEELRAKLDMCRHLHLKPLFIMRGAPKSYIHDINLARGFALIYKYQLYPHGQGDFAKEVRDTLHLPVDSPSAIQDATVQRFERWHLRNLQAPEQRR